MNDPKMLDTCERLISEIAPEIKRPTYLIDPSSMKDSRLFAGDVMGWTASVADILVRRELERQGRWRGRGFTSVIKLENIRPGFRFVAGVVLHEFAHHLDYLSTPTAEIEMNLPVMDTLPLERETAIDNAIEMVGDCLGNIAEVEDALPTWYGHELNFIRAAVHVAHRANRVFESIRPDHLRFVSPYHYRGCENTAVACCENELDSEMPITEILRSDPPEKLVRYWDYLTKETR
jgi:hypothetical protein